MSCHCWQADYVIYCLWILDQLIWACIICTLIWTACFRRWIGKFIIYTGQFGDFFVSFALTLSTLQTKPNTRLKSSLQKHAYSNILKILPQKHEKFQIKTSDIFHISAQNVDCGYSLELPWWVSSNEYPLSMFWAEIRKIMYTPVNPSFAI